MIHRILALVVLVVSFGSVAGQRLVQKIDPTETIEDIKFDVNTIPVSAQVVEAPNDRARRDSSRSVDLNYPPNVIILPDQDRAFISYTGSNLVMVFHPKTGEIIDFVEVGTNPGQLTLSPDGRYLAVPSFFLKRNIPNPDSDNFEGERIGELSLIDVESLEVETLFLEEYFPSVVNNVVFSPDGTKAFLGSAGTDEVLRIDVATLSEDGRLGLTPGSRPTNLTLSPDGQTLAVVLPGSSNLDIAEVPDSLALIDVESFTLRRSIAPDTGGGETPVHFFTAATLPTFSPDGRYLIIADQIGSVSSPVPELGTDRAWLFDFETDEWEFFPVGGLAGKTLWIPYTEEFLVVSTFELNFIDPVVLESRRESPLRSNFRPSSRPALSQDGKFLYVAAPLDDLVVFYNLETGEFPRFVEIGGVVERPVGEPDEGEEQQFVTFSSAPLEVAFTPDGEVLLAINYNANTIDLIRDTKHLFVSRSLSTEEFFTGVALTNLTDQPADVILTGFSTSGGLFQDDPDTEDLVEVTNPRTVTLAGGEQLARTSEELLLSVESGILIDGWIDIDSDQFDFESFYLTGDRAQQRLDGLVAAQSTARRIVIPEVRVDEGFVTQLTVLNPNRQSSSYELGLFNSDGELRDLFTRQLASRSFFTAPVRDPDPEDDVNEALFDESAFEEFEDGFMILEIEHGAVALARVFDDARLSYLQGFAIDEPSQLPQEQMVSQVATFGGAETFIKVVNALQPPEEEEDDSGEGDEQQQEEPDLISVQLELFDNFGNPLGMPATLELGPWTSIRRPVSELFQLVDPGAVVGGWIRLESDQPGIVASAELQLFEGRAASMLPFQAVSAASTRLVFSHVAEGLGLSTGLSLINPGSETANATLTVWTASGDVNRTGDLQILPGERTSRLLDEFFADFGEQIGGYLTVESDQPLAGVELFFADDLRLVSAVLAQ